MVAELRLLLSKLQPHVLKATDELSLLESDWRLLQEVTGRNTSQRLTIRALPKIRLLLETLGERQIFRGTAATIEWAAQRGV
jgi:hypothetical protein